MKIRLSKRRFRQRGAVLLVVLAILAGIAGGIWAYKILKSKPEVVISTTQNPSFTNLTNWPGE